MKKFISLLLSIMLISSTCVLAKDYSDYPQRFWDVPKDHWAFEYISELVDKNVLSGYEDGSYRPEETVTRAEWSKMMVVASGKQEVKLNNNGSYAVDYNSNDWYYGYINAVVDYMNFYNESDGTYFKPNQAVSREDVTVSLVKLKGYDTDNVDYSVVMKFKDNASISNSIKKYVAVGIEKGLISGYEDNTFRGQDTLTRAEAATLLCRAFQMGNDNKTNNNPDVVNPDENNNSNSNTSDDTQNDVNNNGNGNTNVSNNDENKEDKKEYKVETLAKANIKTYNNNYQPYYTQDSNNNLYYYDNDTHDIVKVNMLTKEQEILENSDSLTIEYDGQEYSNMTIDSIFYDNVEDTLVAYGSFKNNNSYFETKGEDLYCLYEFKTSNIRVYDKIYDKYVPSSGYDRAYYSQKFYFNGTLDNGDYLVHYVTGGVSASSSYNGIIDKNTGKIKNIKVAKGYTEPLLSSQFSEYEGNIYFVGSVRYDADEGLFKYNYNELTKISDLPFKSVINNKAIAVLNNCVSIFTLNGEEYLRIMYEDININDKSSIDIHTITPSLLLSSNDDIVFYDTNTNSFRMISKND